MFDIILFIVDLKKEYITILNACQRVNFWYLDIEKEYDKILWIMEGVLYYEYVDIEREFDTN